ncbi:hypothetical protein GCM10028773_61300 [Spirosoma koreense]
MTAAPTALNANIVSSQWTSGAGTFGRSSFNGADDYALGNTNAATFTLTLTVAQGYSMAISSVSLQHRTFAVDATYKLQVNGADYGSPFLIKTSTSSTTQTAAASNLAGTVTVTLVYVNNAGGTTSNTAIDDFTINGTVTPLTTLWVNDNSIADGGSTTAVGNDNNAGTQESPFLTLGKAIAIAQAGATIKVDPGTYSEDITVSKSLTISGPNAGVAGTSGSRATEAKLADGTISVSGTGNVVIDGFHIYQTNNTQNIIQLAGETPVTFQNSKLERVGTTPGQTVRAIVTSSGSGVKTIANNLFTGSDTGGLFSNHVTWNNGIYINGSASTVNVTGNTFEKIRSALNLDDYNPGVNISGNTFNPNGTDISFGGATPTSGAHTLGANTFYRPLDGLINLSNVDNTFRLDISSSTFTGTNFNTSTLADLFGIETTIYHRGRSNRKGLVYYKTGNQYVVNTLTTLQSAVDYGATNDIIHVSTGTFNEEITANKALTFEGANVGVAGNASRTTETIISGNNGAHAGFVVTANNVTIDGFTISGAGGTYGAGVYSSPTTSGLALQNNILTDNVIGAYPSSNGASSVKHNLFNANNRAGAAGGAGIYVEATNGLTVEDNEFKGHTTNSAVIFGASAANAHQNLTFTKNYIHDNNDANSMVYLLGLSNSTISYNTILQSGATAIKVAGGNAGVSILNNMLDGNTTAIKLQNDAIGPNTGIQAHNNSLVSTKSIDNLDAATVDASCNWYGSSVPGDITAKISGPVTYAPYTTVGTDGNGNAAGFEPAPNSCTAPVRNITQNKYFATIQSAINDPVTVNGDVIEASNGTFNEDVLITKSITLQGESRNGTIVKGLLKDGTPATAAASARTIIVATDNVTVKNLTITRDYGGNQAGWNASQKTEGIIIENKDNLTIDNVLVVDNRNGVYLHNTKNSVVKNSEVIANRTGFQVWGPLDNDQIINNIITGNFTHGILFNFDQGPTSAPGMKISNNNISGNWYSQINFQRSSGTPAGNVGDFSTLDLSCNWYGAVPTATVGAVIVPGYTAQTTSQFGGMAPATTLYIAGEEAAGKNYAPYLNNGTDNDPSAGFQPVPNSCVAPVRNTTHPKYFATIQSAINDPITVNGDVIEAMNGTYNEDVVITKSITLQGESRDGTIVKGLLKDGTPATAAASPYSFVVNADDVTVKNLTVTRDYGGNQAGWNASQKSYGLIIENKDRLTVDNVLVVDNRNGVYLHNTKNTVVKNSTIRANRTGFQVFGPLDNVQIINNFITGNFTHGFLFNFDQGPTSAPGMKISNNNISGNWYSQITFQRSSGTPAGNVGDFSTLDLTCNWYGAAPTTTVGTVSVPGYTDQLTSQFGGNAPATTLYIAGEEAAGKNYVPFLNNGTDNDPAAGFQPVPGSCASPVHNITRSKDFGTIQAAINDPATQPGDVIRVDAGSYSETLSITKNLIFEGANRDVCGTTTRTAETVLVAPATATGLISLSGPVSVTFNGFKIDGLGVAYLNDYGQNLTINNSVFELDFIPAQNNLYSNAGSVNLNCNYFKAIAGTNDGSASHIFIGHGALTATNNKFTSETAIGGITPSSNSLPVWLNLTADANNLSVQNNEFTKIDIGILLAANAGNAVIQNNEFKEAKRDAYASGAGYGAGIAFFENYTPAGPVAIRNNKFSSSETGIRTSAGGVGPYTLPATNLLTVSYNSFESITVAAVRLSDAYNASANKLNALCNWYGGVVGPTVSTNAGASGTSPIVDGGNKVLYKNWLGYGNDADAALGFQIPTGVSVVPGNNVSQAENNYRVLSNAVGCLVSGQTLTLSGTFDWTQSIAQAEWAKGNNGEAGDGVGSYTGTGDDYTITAPTNVTNVTITAASLGSATILGPGDLPGVSLETPLFLNANTPTSSFKNWTISNLTFNGFDTSIDLDNNGGPVDAYDNLKITNNEIRIPADLNAVEAMADDIQNLGIYYTFGKNIEISANKIYMDGSGQSADATSKYATTVGIQSATSGGTAYDGLKIINNQFVVTGLPKATQPAIIRGIWENGHNKDASITISGNKFTNENAGNTGDVNRQLAFWVTSRSGASHSVVYQNNEVSGYNTGIAWLGGPYTTYSAPDYEADATPVQILNNKFDGVSNAVVVRKSAASANTGSPAVIHNNSFTNLVYAGFDITNASMGTTDATCNWFDHRPEVSITGGGDVTYLPRLTSGTDESGDTGFQQANPSCSSPSDLSPRLTVSPSTLNGNRALTAVVEVFNLGDAPTSGTITVYVSKQSRVTFTFQADATTVNNQPVQNGSWQFDGTSNANFYILTTTATIAAGDKLSFGLNGNITPNGTSGKLSFGASVVQGSGSELDADNNSDVDSAESFAQ